MQSAISFESNGLEMEGIIAKPDTGRAACPIAVLCNAHPGLFGALNHTLMDTLSTELVKAGIATLRFNYRGIGASQGTFTNGEQEPTDVAAAVAVANIWPGVRKGHVGVIGYSFGAGVLLKTPEKMKGVKAAVLIAPPLASLDHAAMLKEKLPKLVVLGEQDRVAPPTRIQELLAPATNAQTYLVPKVNHSWRGGEAQTVQRCVEFLTQHIK